MVVTYFPGRGTIFEKRYLEGLIQGWTDGWAASGSRCVMRVLELRRIPVPPHLHKHIVMCTDLVTISQWLDRVMKVGSAEELLELIDDASAAADAEELSAEP